MSRSLLGVLLVVVVLAVAAALAVTSLTGTTVTVPRGALPGSTGPTASGQPAGAAAPTVDRSALIEACNADATSVDDAVQAYTAATGMPPPNLAALATAQTVEGQTIGPWLRSVPGTAHYTIYVDSRGHVGVLPARAVLSGPVPAIDDYVKHPELCALVPS